MKTADETLAQLRAAAAARKARFHQRQAEAGIQPLHVAVPVALRTAFCNLAAKARAGAPLDFDAMVLCEAPPLATAPVPEASPVEVPPEPAAAATVPEASPTEDAETLQLLDAGRRIKALLGRHPELNTVLHSAVVTKSGEFVSMLHTLFPPPIVAVHDTQAVAPVAPQSVAVLDTPIVAEAVAHSVPRRPAFAVTPSVSE